MNIQSVTVNTQPAVAQPVARAPAQPDVRAEQSPQPAIRSDGAANSPDARQERRQASEQQVREAVDNIERFVTQSVRDITFSIDRDSGFTVKIVDRTSHDVIRQIPSEEVIAISRALDKLQGLFVRDKI